MSVPMYGDTVLSVEDAAAHLNITGTSSDEELQATIDAAVARLSQEVGPLSAVSVSKRVPTAGMFLLLPVAPAQSLTSVSDVRAGQAVDLTLLTLDKEAATIYFTDGSTRFRSPSYDVQYVAGWGEIPGDILFAAKELTRHLWQTQRGNPMLSDQLDTAPAGFALPNRVLEMIAPYRQSVVG